MLTDQCLCKQQSIIENEKKVSLVNIGTTKGGKKPNLS